MQKIGNNNKLGEVEELRRGRPTEEKYHFTYFFDKEYWKIGSYPKEHF